MVESLAKADYRLRDDVPSFSHDAWHMTPIARKRMKQLMRRRDLPGCVNYALWLSLLLVSGVAAYYSWGSWWAWPTFMVYGLLYGSCSDSRWHECAHGTAFRSTWLNEGFYQLTSFMSLRNPVLWRWSHSRHHTDTIVVGRDPEIAYPRPPSLSGMLLNLLYLKAGAKELRRMLSCSFGRLSADDAHFLPEHARAQAFRVARGQLATLLAVVACAWYWQSWLPLLYVGLPTFYGSWLHHIFSITQHAGLQENIPDHRLNSRTVYLNPIFCYVYSNMNYHVEHHMYPMVPFYALPELHREMQHDCPPAYPSLYAAFKEILPTVWRQQSDPTYYATRILPASATTAAVAA